MYSLYVDASKYVENKNDVIHEMTSHEKHMGCL